MKIQILSVLLAGCLLACTAPTAPDESVGDATEELTQRCAEIACSATFTDWLVDHPAECGVNDFCHYSVMDTETECIWQTCTSNIIGPSHGAATLQSKTVRVTYELDGQTAPSCAPFCAPEYKPKFNCQ